MKKVRRFFVTLFWAMVWVIAGPHQHSCNREAAR
jgi:hypothetical protein